MNVSGSGFVALGGVRCRFGSAEREVDARRARDRADEEQTMPGWGWVAADIFENVWGNG